MYLYHYIKNRSVKRGMRAYRYYRQFRDEISARRYMRSLMRKHNLPELTKDQINQAKSYYKSRGYKLKNTYWHQYYTGMNGEFHKEYLPYDIFNPIINPRLNQIKQWPALLDKNFTYTLFKDFNQPKRIVQNINGFYFINDDIVSLDEAVEACKSYNKPLIIKPTIETGSGKMVNRFVTEGEKTSLQNQSIKDLFKVYKKDFVVQECLEQSDVLKSLNPSSLNTLRVVSYLNDQGVHITTSVLRVGKDGCVTDNFSTGGLFCGIEENGDLKGKGYGPKGEVFETSYTGINLKDCKIPNYSAVKEMVKSMHFVVPYFKIISWDIGLDKNNTPYLIEYNTTKQGIDLQIAAGPYLGKFTDEILAMGLK